MKITKNLRISIVFMASVLVSTMLCISLLYQLASRSSQTAMQTGMHHNMDTYLQAELSTVQEFVTSSASLQQISYCKRLFEESER